MRPVCTSPRSEVASCSYHASQGERGLLAHRQRRRSVVHPAFGSEHGGTKDRCVLAAGAAYRFEPGPKREHVETVSCRLSVKCRVPMKQILCVGGGSLPFGWAFTSIAAVPMTWNPGDIWTLDVDLEVGEKITYKYVILEEQQWTRLDDPDSQGLVTKHRTGADPAPPPDQEVMKMQMSIVSWQPGPNRQLHVPQLEELKALKPGTMVGREPAKAQACFTERDGVRTQLPDISSGTVEVLSCSETGELLLDRRDVWAAPGWDIIPPPTSRPPL